jgi:hypothetical protein
MRELRLALDPVVEAPVALAPLIDPNLHSCGTVPPHGFTELHILNQMSSVWEGKVTVEHLRFCS